MEANANPVVSVGVMLSNCFKTIIKQTADLICDVVMHNILHAMMLAINVILIKIKLHEGLVATLIIYNCVSFT